MPGSRLRSRLLAVNTIPEGSHAMGDKGGKKDKDKGQKQKAAKEGQKAQKNQDKQPKRRP
jgi:hypothetical protein